MPRCPNELLLGISINGTCHPRCISHPIANPAHSTPALQGVISSAAALLMKPSPAPVSAEIHNSTNSPSKNEGLPTFGLLLTGDEIYHYTKRNTIPF